MTTNILIVCTNNSARSVLAEGTLNHWARRFGKNVRAFSAGTAPGEVNPHALKALQEAGIETGNLRSKSWNEFVDPRAPKMRVVITVCDAAAEDASLELLGNPVRVHWSYQDPADAPDGANAIAFRQTCQSLSDRMMQLVELPFDELSDEDLRRSLCSIGST